MAGDPVALRLKDVRSGYGEIEVLKGLTTDVLRGEVFSVIGANGAGKSTLLKTIFGLVQPTDGEIVCDGVNIAGSSPFDILALGISYVPQGRSNFPAMSIQENLEMGAYTRKDKGGVQADINKLYEQFPLLKDKRDEAAGNLSGGQQQVLEMAIALVLNPAVLLIDEPTLGLAPAMVEGVFSAIKEINELGTTVIMVEQNAKRALEISDHGIVLELGVVRFEGTGQVLLHDPDVRSHYLGL